MRAVQYLPDGVVLAVVDPGVGTDRRCIAVEVEDGFLVGPDNGLLAPAVAMLGGPTRVVELDDDEYQLPAPGPTFAGRDVMAPAAAYLAAGVPIGELGPDVDPASLAPGSSRCRTRPTTARIAGEVLWVDRFGNCQLNLAPEQLEDRGVDVGGAIGSRIGERDGARAGCARSRGQAIGARRARRLLRHVRAGARPALRRVGAQAPCRPVPRRRDPGATMRRRAA